VLKRFPDFIDLFGAERPGFFGKDRGAAPDVLVNDVASNRLGLVDLGLELGSRDRLSSEEVVVITIPIF
jgi:hypothetical protein